MNPEISFFFYLGAIICFVLATVGELWKWGSRTRRGVKPAVSLMPLGLALALFPTLWTTAILAY